MSNAYFINVGQGNMAVVVFDDDYVIVYGCNITSGNVRAVYAFMASSYTEKYDRLVCQFASGCRSYARSAPS